MPGPTGIPVRGSQPERLCGRTQLSATGGAGRGQLAFPCGHKPEAGFADSTPLGSWWTVLNDPTLNQLVDQALAENKTVKQALARVTEARARRAIAGASFWPS